MDNVRFHHTLDVKILCREKDIALYNPDLNKTENVLLTIKHIYSLLRLFRSTSVMIKTFKVYFERLLNYLILAYSNEYFYVYITYVGNCCIVVIRILHLSFSTYCKNYNLEILFYNFKTMANLYQANTTVLMKIIMLMTIICSALKL